MNCEKCNSEMEYYVKGQCCGWICDRCGWGIATTYINPGEMDNTLYTVKVNTTADADISQIRTVASIIACSFIEAKRKLQSGLILSDISATAAIESIKKLKDCGLMVSVVPEFPYDISELG